MHADRVNRAALAILGLLLLALGVSGILLGASVFGDRAAHRKLLDNSVSHDCRRTRRLGVASRGRGRRRAVESGLAAHRPVLHRSARRHHCGRRPLRRTYYPHLHSAGRRAVGRDRSYRGVHSTRTAVLPAGR